MKVRKKPVEVEAMQWTGSPSIVSFIGVENCTYNSTPDGDCLLIKTLEGVMKADVGDYIIKGVNGEFYPCKEEIFLKTYDFVEDEEPKTTKSLANTDSNGAKKNVKDIQFWGDGDTFKLISKASSENEGWMKSTKAMQVEGMLQTSVVVQVTTQQRNPDGSYSVAEAVTHIPDAYIKEKKDESGAVISRAIKHGGI
ncbi:hypothetical protein [uncultured Arcobacter sp.]|uniref:hypothetical protein n=1 Tax=uncultured Arcobacter sp. TaxID=165434 RepID=UPI00262F8E76|nr:hypothetical protein [uncultured Arcobacter sp.]